MQYLIPVIAAFFLGRWSRGSRHHHLHNPPVKIGFYIEGKRMNSMINLKVSKQIALVSKAEDEFGNPTSAFDSAPTYSVVDSTLGSIVALDDGTPAFRPSGKLGTTKLQVVGQADGKPLMGTSEDIVLLAGDAVDLVVQFGAISDAPVAVAAPAPAAPSA